ncbi:hypothetical protein V8F33_007254 [Rhypophila sp. PSN 637]
MTADINILCIFMLLMIFETSLLDVMLAKPRPPRDSGLAVGMCFGTVESSASDQQNVLDRAVMQ